MRYEDALDLFRDRCEPLDDCPVDYMRGGVNLLADLFPVRGLDTGARMEQIERDLRRTPHTVVYEVQGTITLPDGSTSEFIIERDSGWQQAGADSERLSKTSALLTAMTEAVRDHFPTESEED